MSLHDESLESGSIADIRRSKAAIERGVRFHWDYYSELAYKRRQIYDPLRASLRDRAVPFEFPHYQRVVTYRFALDPLNSKGSLVDPGGRFNIGAIDRSRFPTFPALYLASDKGTALAERLGRSSVGSSLSPEDLALTRPESITVVSVSGKLEAVLDIRDHANVAAFVDLIKGFKLSTSLAATAKALNISVTLIKTAQELCDSLNNRDWRQWPMLWDVPAPSQIFGRIVLDAQIEGIVYNSTLTNRPCVCVLHQNFQNSLSFLELDDVPPPGTVRRRLDASNCGL